MWIPPAPASSAMRSRSTDRTSAGRASRSRPSSSRTTTVRPAARPLTAVIAHRSMRHVLVAARDARGVFQFEGIMVDAPVLRRAERIIQLAPHPGS
jgi:citrate lyase subunit beta / citryl-CoA lyase